MNIAIIAIAIVRAPSMKNNHLWVIHEYNLSVSSQIDGMHYLHAACPSDPCIPLRIPDAMREPNALLMILPQ